MVGCFCLRSELDQGVEARPLVACPRVELAGRNDAVHPLEHTLRAPVAIGVYRGKQIAGGIQQAIIITEDESTPKLVNFSEAAFRSPSKRFWWIAEMSQDKCPPRSTGSFWKRWISFTWRVPPSKLPESIFPPLAPRSKASAFMRS